MAGRLFTYAYRHTRLMEESESRVEMTVYLHTPADVAASRLLENPGNYRHWEAEHSRLMRAVSEQGRLANQIAMLRTTAFRLVHRRALFEYLRVRRLTGAKRHKLLALFYGSRDYANALIAEHHQYVRSTSSYLCAQHLGENLMHDSAFDEPLRLYEQWYSEYFNAYCDSALEETEEERRATSSLGALAPLLKQRVAEARQAILLMPQAPQKEWREVEIRKPNGDTQRLRTLFGNQ